jgi:16S rRNA (adenine1518-N6/adenine1519-N6)-dimethyltransferase
MLQKEFAERIVATEGNKKYGIISIYVQYYGEVEIVHFVKRSCFFPPPKVDSAIVKIKVREKPKIDVLDENFFFEMIKTIFQKRRKTIFNSLLKSNKFKFEKEEIEKALFISNIEKSKRPENIGIEKLGILSNVFSKYKN